MLSISPRVTRIDRTSGDRVIMGIALGVFALHLVVNLVTPYGIHRDELLYLAMGRHLRLLHMDFPPLIAILANLERLFGDSLLAIRFLPAAAHGALIVLAGRFAREFGGGRYGRLLAVQELWPRWEGNN